MIDILLLEKVLEEHGAEFAKYCELLLKWNRAYNLTAITEPDEIWDKHFLDSLVPLPFLPENGTLLDVGSGAGFPGIPLKIARPSLSVTLLEATQKKCNFCEAVIRELGLKDIRVVHGRIPPEKYDAAISRATTSLKELLKNYNSSKVIAMKGADVSNELKGVKEHCDVENYSIAGHRYSLIIVSR